MKHILTITILILLLNSCSSPKTPEAIKYEKISKIIEAGNPLPNFTAFNEKGKSMSNTQFNKGDVFYMFWGTWCGSCIDNIVAVKEMKKMELLDDIQFVSVSVDKEKDKWENFLFQYDMADYMENLLIGKDREHILSSFIYQEMITAQTGQIVYHYMTPAYCLVKDGIIINNKPILPEDRKAFLAQFD